MANTILLIEDDELLRELLGELLADDGFNVIQASDGLEAQTLAKTTSVSAIVCDLMMPNLDGMAFVQWLREQKIATPVIVLSGARDSQLMDDLKELGVTDHFRKPLTGVGLAGLSERLQQLVNG